MHFVIRTTIVIAVVISFTQCLHAQTQAITARQAPVNQNAEKLGPQNLGASNRAGVNKNVVTIMSANPDGGSLQTIYDIATVLERTSKIRVIPIVGRGSAQNIKDIIHLRGVDMALMQPHVIEYLQKTGRIAANFNRRIAYITTLFTDDIHVFSHGGIENFKDLQNKRVNFSVEGSGTQVSMRLIFKALGIEVQEFNMRQIDALELMKQGKLDATVCTCSQPLQEVKAFKKTVAGLKLLPIPYTTKLEKTFFPGSVAHEDYPDLISPGQSINTIAVQSVLGVYNWSEAQKENYTRIGRFIDAFFNNIKEFHTPPRQPKWWSVNIAAHVDDFERFAHAQNWLNRRLISKYRVNIPTSIDGNLAQTNGGGSLQSSPTFEMTVPPLPSRRNKISNQLP